MMPRDVQDADASLTSLTEIESLAGAFRECFAQLQAEIGRVFVGQRAVVDQLLLCHSSVRGTC